MTFRNNLKFIGVAIFVFCLPFILFIANLITAYSKTGQFQWAGSATKSSIYFLIISIIIIPGFLLHYKYYTNDKAKSLSITSTHIELIDEAGTTKVLYSDIEKVESHYMFWNTINPWRGYGYTKLFLKNGLILSYTGLTYDYKSSMTLFRSNQVQLEEYEEIYPWLK